MDLRTAGQLDLVTPPRLSLLTPHVLILSNPGMTSAAQKPNLCDVSLPSPRFLTRDLSSFL